jgi:hypothetical protein
MVLEDNNHFCIYCGAKLVANQHFCSQCGREVYRSAPKAAQVHSKYEAQIAAIEQEYNLKQAKATELVQKLFDSDHLTYQKFTSAITKSNQLFTNQLKIAQKMMELDDNKLVEGELENKIKLLQAFITKMDDLTNELVINMSSNKRDNDDINNLFRDMDDLIDSVKHY